MSNSNKKITGKVQFTAPDGRVSQLFDVEDFIKEVLLMQSQALIAHGVTPPEAVVNLFLQRLPPSVSQF